MAPNAQSDDNPPPGLMKLDSFSSSASCSTASDRPESWAKLTFPFTTSSASSPPNKRKGCVGVWKQVNNNDSISSLSPSDVDAGSVPNSPQKTVSSSSSAKKSLPPLSPGNTPISSKKKKNLVATKTIQATLNVVDDAEPENSSSNNNRKAKLDLSKLMANSKNTLLEVSSTVSTSSASDTDSSNDAALTAAAARKASRNLLRPPSIVENDDGDKSSNNNKQNRRIRFLDGHKMQEIESHKDFSPKERGKCWYSAKDKEKMMARHERVVARMEKKKPPKTSNQTYRGLESWTTEGAQHLDQVIALSVNVVMDEQDRQWKVNVDDFDLIAAKSIEVTTDSAQRARIVGLEDQKEAFAARETPWLASDDVSCASTVMSKSIKSQAAAKKLKEISSKKRERIDEGDKAKSLKSSKGVSKSKKGKKLSKKKPEKSSSMLDDKLKELTELSMSEHADVTHTTPYLRSSLALSDHAERSDPHSSSVTSKTNDDSDSRTSDLLAALRERRSARSGAPDTDPISVPPSPSKSSKSKDKKKSKTKPPLSPTRPPSSPTKDPPGRRGSIVRTASDLGPYNKDLTRQLDRSQSARDIRSASFSEAAPPSSPSSVSSKRLFSNPEKVKGMLKAPQRLYERISRSSKDLCANSDT